MSDPPAVESSRRNHRDQQREEQLADASAFIDELRKIQKTNRGQMSALKRHAGDLLGDKNCWFYALLPKRKDRWRYREVYYLVATLFDFHRRVRPTTGNFGVSMLRLAREMGKEPKEFRRFHILMDAEFETVHDREDQDAPWSEGGGELAFRLRQMVKLMAAKEVGIDWPELLVDLCHWSHPNRQVQKKWARSYFGAPASEPASIPEMAEAAG
jgi:CRISPR system Cascade subunit CasB